MDTNNQKKSSSSKISDIIASVQAQISGDDVIDKPAQEIDKTSTEDLPPKNLSEKVATAPDADTKTGGVVADINKNPNRKRKILVVDDDSVTLEIMKHHLQKDYAVFGVTSGKLALDFLSKNSVDLIFLDYMMPEMDGPTAFLKIRCEFPKQFIPIIFLTGVSEKELVIKGLELYPTDYLLKPVNQAVLLERVHKVLFE